MNGTNPPAAPSPLSPIRAAVATAAENVAANLDNVVVGSLRIRVLHAIDVPRPKPLETKHLTTTSWLHFLSRKASLPRHEAVPERIYVLIRMKHSQILATEARPWASAICWDEEFYIEHVQSNDEVEFFCLDRAKDKQTHVNGSPVHGHVHACSGLIGKVTLPLVRLPQGQALEQWYPLVLNDCSSTSSTALRVYLCFVPNKRPTNVSPIPDPRRKSSLLQASPLTERLSTSPVSNQLCPPVTPTTAFSLEKGLIDYVLVVTTPENEDWSTNGDEASVAFRYPATDRRDFPLPTKIEWFCFPSGFERIVQSDRPESKLFSFVLVGGDDGLCRCYVICLVVYHRRVTRHRIEDKEDETAWHATCLAFLTRLPLIEQVTRCLLAVAHAWISNTTNDQVETMAQQAKTWKHLHALCHDLPLPVRGVFGVAFRLHKSTLKLVIPSKTSIYTNARTPVTRQLELEPLVYSLEPIFQLFDPKTITQLVMFVLCEYRLLLHSSHQSRLCPVAEGLCALLSPFRWQHPYVPMLPCVLSEYLQAPLPYILGIHTAWLPRLLETGRPDHLVLVDIDRGTFELQESHELVLPRNLTEALHCRLNRILKHRVSKEEEKEGEILPSDRVEWRPEMEIQVRQALLCFLAVAFRGYRECLVFVNQKLPVFNKRRFLEAIATDDEVIPFVTRVFHTQAFQSFLESHYAVELSAFHAVYSTSSRLPKDVHLFDSTWTSLSQQPPGITKDVPVLIVEENCSNVRVDGDDQSVLSCSLNDDDIVDGKDEVKALKKAIELVLKAKERVEWDPFALEKAAATVSISSFSTMTLESLAQQLDIELELLKAHAMLLVKPHQVNQNRLHLDGTLAAMALNGPGSRLISSEDERVEQSLYKCLTAVFTSDNSLTERDIRACEMHFQTAHAREVFANTLLQPSDQVVENEQAIAKTGGSKHLSKGSGTCLATTGFQLLARVTAVLMEQCTIQEDYTTARRVLQIAPLYYHLVDDKHSGVGCAKKEYLLTPFRLLPLCQSLDLWQHAFSFEIEALHQADPTENVDDERFFSVLGNLMYDMLNLDVSLGKVWTFVAGMCSTYNKGQDVLETLKQLAQNVSHALEMSKDTPSTRPTAFQSRIKARISIRAASPTTKVAFKTTKGKKNETSLTAVSADELPVVSRAYDLNTVIRRKLSADEMPKNASSGLVEAVWSANGRLTMDWDWKSRRRSGTVYPSATLASSGSPVLSLATGDGRAVCGMANARVNVMNVASSIEDNGVRLDGHSDAVVAVVLRGPALVSGSRDHTLRVWDLGATASRRPLLHLFSLSSTSSGRVALHDDDNVDGTVVSNQSLVLRGHLAPITCMELGPERHRALVASGSDDGTVRLWDTTNENSVALLSGHKRSTSFSSGSGSVNCLQLLASEHELAVGYRRRTLEIWDLTVCRLKCSVPAHYGAIRAVHVAGSRLVTAANDRVVKVWDAAFRGKEQAVHVLGGHGGPVQCLGLGGFVDPNVCTGASDGWLHVWDLRAVERGPRLKVQGHCGPVTCLERDFTKLVSAGDDGMLRVWNLHSGACLYEIEAHEAGVTCLEMHDSVVYSGSWDGTVRVFDFDNMMPSGSWR